MALHTADEPSQTPALVEASTTDVEAATHDVEATQETQHLVRNLSRSSAARRQGDETFVQRICPGLLGADRNSVITGVFFGILAILMIAVWTSAVSFMEHKDELHVRFLVVGDWGRNGGSNQTLVADAMGRVSRHVKLDFVISTGDNFYESGLTHPQDDQFRTSYMDIYTAPSLQVPWYAVLGNHDYGEVWNDDPSLRPPNCPPEGDCYYSPLHELDIALWHRDRRWHCQRYFKRELANGDVAIFFIDTNPFLDQYQTVAWAKNPGGILQQSWQAQLRELEADLARSRARWKLVVGHHPVRNSHMPENTRELLENLEPLLEKYGVRLYMSGHEHNLQHIHVDGASTHYMISGGGSLTDYSWETWDNGGAKYFYQGSGFVICELRDLVLACQYHGIIDDTPVYHLEIPLREPRA